MLICLLAQYLTWHLRRAMAPLTYTDQHPTPQREDPVTPATRSAHTQAKAARHTDDHGHPLHSFRGLLGHLARQAGQQALLPESSHSQLCGHFEYPDLSAVTTRAPHSA